MNRNGRVDGYEDWRKGAKERAADLVAQMTLEEKAGAMMHANPPTTSTSAVPGAGSAWDVPGISALLLQKHITSFLNRLATDAGSMATQQNQLQAIAEQGRLGIPVSLSTDPRSQFKAYQGVSVNAMTFTQWPDPTGLAATGDPELVRQFAAIVRQEYRAVGIRIALSPQADITVHPRWHRTSGTFGSDETLATRMVNAYVSGMQAGATGLGKDSVVAVVKHWVGYGATAPDGFDAHNIYGRHLHATGAEIERHMVPFTGAFAAHVGSVMPSYGLLPEGIRVKGTPEPIEHVGMGFNKQMLTDVLRGRFGFDGVIVSDWQITDDCNSVCRNGTAPGQKLAAGDIAMPWGVESVPRAERFAKAVLAGVDQFGGAKEPETLVALVHQKKLTETAVNAAVLRIMVQKFEQGLFEDPYVDAATAPAVVGQAAFWEKSAEVQRRSVVLIKNTDATLPLKPSRTPKVYLYQVSPEVARQRGFTVVDTPDQADVALVALTTPAELLHPTYFFGSRYREGDTAFKDGGAEYEAFKRISAMVPTVVSVYLERPADLSRLAGQAAAIVGNFGISQDALFDVLDGSYAPTARLPYDLPWTDGNTPARASFARLRGEGLSY